MTARAAGCNGIRAGSGVQGQSGDFLGGISQDCWMRFMPGLTVSGTVRPRAGRNEQEVVYGGGPDEIA